MLLCNLYWVTLSPPCEYDVCAMEYFGELCFPLGVPCFLHATMMYVQWSTVVKHAFPLIICARQLYSLPATGLDPDEKKACVAVTAQFVP